MCRVMLHVVELPHVKKTISLQSLAVLKSTVAWMPHYCTSKWTISFFSLLHDYIIIEYIACWHNTHMQQYHANMHLLSCCLWTGAQYVLCLHHCPLTSGISRATHKDRLSRERTHAAALFDQVIKKCMPCLNISGFLFFIFNFFFFALYYTAAASVFILSTVTIQQCFELSYPAGF